MTRRRSLDAAIASRTVSMHIDRAFAPTGRLRAFLLGVLLLAMPRAARATSCASTASASLRNGADAVFVGVVEGSRPSLRHPLTQVVMRIRVLRAWHGAVRDREELAWELDERWMGADAFGMVLRGDALRGDTLLVAAWEVDGQLTTGFCAFWSARGSEREMAALGPGRVPTVTAPAEDRGTWWAWTLLGGAALLATAVLRRAGRRVS